MISKCVDAREDPSAAAARELREETGIVIEPQDLQPFHATSYHITYVPTQPVKIPSALESVPFEGVVSFFTPGSMLRWARHPEYLETLLKKAGVL